MSIIKAIAIRLNDNAIQGGYMHCQPCNECKPVGDIEKNITSGWPDCDYCGRSMKWITGNQTHGYKMKPHPDGGDKFFIETPKGGLCFVGNGRDAAGYLNKIVQELDAA